MAEIPITNGGLARGAVIKRLARHPATVNLHSPLLSMVKITPERSKNGSSQWLESGT